MGYQLPPRGFWSWWCDGLLLGTPPMPASNVTDGVWITDCFIDYLYLHMS